MKVGVLAVQGNFREHAAMLRRLGAEVVEVRLPEELDGLDGLVIPGGESTAIGPDVKVLAELNGEPVLLRQGRVLVASFHPELTDDTRVHERFLELIREETNVGA